MVKKTVVQNKFQSTKEQFIHELANFEQSNGPSLWNERNQIKIITIDGTPLAVKSFRIPHLFNQLVYRFFRKSKARRSFEHSIQLQSLGIGTPKAFGYEEWTTSFLFKKSYYASEYLETDATFRTLIHEPDFPERTKILQAFTAFTHNLHEQGVNFLDHSPGNTLIKKNGDSYDFYLVDVNRMKFGTMNFSERIQNFARLTKEEDMIVIMAKTYAGLIQEDERVVTKRMLHEVERFQSKLVRKKQWKKRIKFWK